MGDEEVAKGALRQGLLDRRRIELDQRAVRARTGVIDHQVRLAETSSSKAGLPRRDRHDELHDLDDQPRHSPRLFLPNLQTYSTEVFGYAYLTGPGLLAENHAFDETTPNAPGSA